MRIVPYLVLAATIELLWLAVRKYGDPAHVAETVILLVATSLVYIVCCYLVLRAENSRSICVFIYLAAIAFRLTAWGLEPVLSDDVFRYRWEGKLQNAGGNPYQVRPNDPDWAALRDAAFWRVPGRDFKAAYGPLIELEEHVTYRMIAAWTPDPQAQVFWFKLPGAIFDLGILGALAALLAAHGRPAAHALVYAWSPLPVIEFWGNGHHDSIVILLVLLALLAAARTRWMWAFVALSLAAAAKVWPLLLFPAFIGWTGRRPARWWQWLVLLPIALLLAWPYWSDVSENVRFASGFLGGWRNNDSLFGPLLWLSGDIYRAKYLAFALVGGASVVLALPRWPLERATLGTITAMLAISANVHPWYLTWLLPLLAFSPWPPLLLWTALIPLAYETVIPWTILGEWRAAPEMRWLIYGPVFGLIAFRVVAARHRTIGSGAEWNRT